VKLFNQLQTASPDEFKRLTGISKERDHGVSQLDFKIFWIIGFLGTLS